MIQGALARLNPNLPAEALDDAFRKLTCPEGSALTARNRAFHRMAVDGVTVEYRDAVGGIRGAQVQVLDFEQPANNDWLAVNQFTVAEGNHERRPDIVLFVNGLPLAVIELKNPGDEDATIRSAWQQLRTYQAELPSLFTFNAVLAVSDGVEARLGTLTAGWEWFKPWRTISGEELAPVFLTQLQVAIEGAFEKRRFLALLRDFIVFEDDGGGRLAKKMAGYHQFHAVATAVGETLRAAELQRAADVGEEPGRYESGRKPGGNPGDRRIGVVWHTQGSGKSLTDGLLCRAHHPRAGDGQPDRGGADRPQRSRRSALRHLRALPGPVAPAAGAGPTAGRTCEASSRSKRAASSSPPSRSSSRKRRPDRHPVLSERRNIVVIADEAHRSQYDFIDGFARHMRDALPNGIVHRLHRHAVRAPGRQPPAPVFGDYISVYDIQRAVGRQGDSADLLREPARPGWRSTSASVPGSDPGFRGGDGRRGGRRARRSSRPDGAQLEAVVGADQRLELVAGGHRRALRAAHRGHGRQGDDRLHEPAHLHGSLPRAHAPAPGLARRGRRQGAHQGRHDRLGLRPARLAAPYPQQAPPGGAREPVPRPRGPRFR